MSLNKIATSKSKDSIGPKAVSAASEGDLQSSTNVFFVFKF